MKLVTAMSTAALVLAPAVGLAQDNPANDAGNTKEQPGLVDKVIGTITGRSPDTKKEGASADANKSGNPTAKTRRSYGEDRWRLRQYKLSRSGIDQDRLVIRQFQRRICLAPPREAAEWKHGL